jgi:hypothetical protein
VMPPQLAACPKGGLPKPSATCAKLELEATMPDNIQFAIGDRVRLTELGIARNPKMRVRTGVAVALPFTIAAARQFAFYSMESESQKPSIAPI